MKGPPLNELKSLLGKIALELALAEPGKDMGLLPANCLLGEIEESIETLPEPIRDAMRQARKWLDEIFETTGKFSETALNHLREWAEWTKQALAACEKQEIPQSLPDDWGMPGNPPAAPPAKVSESSVSVKPAAMEEPVINLNVAQDGELLREFINEANEHLQNIEQGVLVLEDNPEDADTLNSIFRAFHTFKGNSGFLNLTAIQTLAHDLESLLDQARQHRLAITPPIINLILAGGDTLKQFVGEINAQLSNQKPSAPIVVPSLALLESVRAVLAGKPLLPVSAPASATPSGPGENPSACSLPTNASKAVAGAGTPSQPPASNFNRPGANGNAVKVDTVKLDSMIDLVGEMVIAQSLVIQNREVALLHSEQLTRDLARLNRISRELQKTAMSLRMVPIRMTFQKMNRLVRDSAAKVGKEAQLVTEGEDTELDRTIVEQISDPLIHMIRNSVDHGIEKPAVRQERGKPAAGTILLKAFHQGGNIVIEVKDDGNGLNRDRILAKAIEKGLAKKDQEFSDSQIFNFILEPGFSTAEKVTDLSGRGVGMDVVRRNIENLRGKLEIQSRPGEGTVFRIYLPLTLAIIDGLLVGVGHDRYILPTLSVCESFRLRPEMINTVQNCGEMVNVRGKLRPLLRLSAHLGIPSRLADSAEAIAVVLEAGNDSRCIVVDQLLGKQEVVIKSLDESFRRNRFVAGAAILGDGRVGLILDPEALVHLKKTSLTVASSYS